MVTASPPVVLVVEDHVELRNVLIDALAWEGYEVVEARNDAEATQILRSRPIDLVVTDPSSPQGDSPELDALEAEFPDLPVIALAGEGGPTDLVFGAWTRRGLRRVLRRPFRLNDLLAACREAVGTDLGEEE